MDKQKIRLRASALLIQDESILLVEFNDENGWHYNLPGGGVDPGETLRDAVQREAREEASAEIEVGPVAFVYEYQPMQNDFLYGDVHSVGVIFDCRIKEGSIPKLSDQPDPHQTGVKWIPLADLPNVQLYPEITQDILNYRKTKTQHRNYIEEQMIQSEKNKR